MKYQTCTCQTTCEDPDGESYCHGNCSGVEGCICQEGYKINGSDCIHMNECGCFLREANFVIPVNLFAIDLWSAFVKEDNSTHTSPFVWTIKFSSCVLHNWKQGC